VSSGRTFERPITMREIKFRAWNTDRKTMHIVTTLFAPNGICNTMELDGEGAYGDLFPLMQFTGLKDKNGKPIYEGDIVEDQQGNIGHFDFYTGNSTAHFGATNFGKGRIPNSRDPVDIQAPFEVIGNIYEKPGAIRSTALTETFGEEV
jgi:uncharacterized phage protein (TIGR01671 family)